MPSSTSRRRLSRGTVLRAAVDLVDAEGLDALTMRRLASELGVEAMSLYHYVANKDALLTGVIDQVATQVVAAVEELGLASPSTDWRGDLRAMILTARQVMLRHPWAPALIAERATLSLPVIVHHERAVGLMREGGFSWDLAHHALHALGSRMMGFTQELFQPAPGEDEPEMPSDAFPNLAGMLASIGHDPHDSVLGWCDDQTEFEFTLDLILAGLERLRASAAA